MRSLLAAVALVLAAPVIAAERVVALGGDVTEFVYALGAGKTLVGVDATSLHPREAQALPNVGYVRQLNAEGILALAPELVIGNADAGPPQVLAQLRDAGVRVEILPNGHTTGTVLQKLEIIATLLDRKAHGEALAQQIAADFKRLAEDVAGIQQPPRVLFMLSPGPGSPMVAGHGTAAHAIIELVGGVNVANSFTGYKPMSAEALASLAPEVILVMEERIADFGIDAVRRAPGVSLTPAARNDRYIVVSGNALLGFGPRTAEAARAFFQELHRE